ncbi:MAG: hypothetical protein ACLFQL_02945 [Paracoccaceae bacterium]
MKVSWSGEAEFSIAGMSSGRLGLAVFEPRMPIDPPLIVGLWHKRSDRTPVARWMREQVFGPMRALDR